jgi:hypothetical protein
VLFEWNDQSNIPDDKAFSSMQRIAKEHDMTYSIHFPIDRKAGVVDSEERRLFRRSVKEVIDRTRGLPVSGYLLHFEGLGNEKNREEVQRWQNVIGDFCEWMVGNTAIDSRLICIENLEYEPVLHQQLVDKYRFSHCIDVGHLWRYGADWQMYLHRVMDTARIIHLHGVVDGNDHRALQAHTHQSQLQELASILHSYRGIVTIEVFGLEDTVSSLAYFGEIWRRSH